MHDLLILGAGPAGLTAGIYGARGGLDTVIVERKSFGGQAAITPEVENYPGVQHTDGFTLTFTMEQQARSFGVDFVYDEVESVSLDGEVKSVTTQNNGVIEAKTAIIACGAEAKKLGVDGETSLIGKGISYCATCDGRFFKGRPVAVVGGGNTAVDPLPAWTDVPIYVAQWCQLALGALAVVVLPMACVAYFSYRTH
ncbi:MAG: FAD-dependent oxidoreductase, partial [Clostridia bacterium]|nr:FAD-dependent oxidoreductase [Clostridia bacterium]